MKTFFLLAMALSLSRPLTVFAQKPHSKSHRHHKAHSHGHAQMMMGFQGANGEFQFEAPAESIYGFEHVAKKETDLKAQTEGLSKLETNLTDIVQFDANLKCSLTDKQVQVNQEKEENHSNVIARVKVACEKSIVNSTINLKFQKYFPKLKNVKVTLIADDVQKSFDAKSAEAKLEVKK